MTQPSGPNIPLSLPRRLIGDLLHFSRQVPLIPIERRMNVANLVAARQAVLPRPSWCSIFTKGLALAAIRHREFRRSFMQFPWPHLYEHPCNVASVTVERTFGGENSLFFAQLREPEQASLADLSAAIRRYKEDDITSKGCFRRCLRISRLPRFLRRSAWWIGLNVSGKVRARFFGTFGVSVTAGLGASVLSIFSPLTVTLYYGVLDPFGSLDVRLSFDHRVLDAATAARALASLEEILHVQILPELHDLNAGHPVDSKDCAA
jgi:hypothetical protein